MDHPAAEDLHPSGLRACPAPGAFAEDARHVNFCRWLGEGEVAGTHPHLQPFAEHALDEMLERGPEMADVNSFVHQEPLRLMKHRRLAHGDLVPAIDASRGEDFHRRFPSLHRSDLSVRRVRAQQELIDVDKERVLGVARRMIGGEIERLEVVPVGLHLRAGIDRIAHLPKDVLHLLAHDGDRMEMTQAGLAAGEGDVEGLARFFAGRFFPRHALGFLPERFLQPIA